MSREAESQLKSIDCLQKTIGENLPAFEEQAKSHASDAAFFRRMLEFLTAAQLGGTPDEGGGPEPFDYSITTIDQDIV